MSLTGPWFLGLVLVVTLAAFVALVALWPRLAGRAPQRIAARVGLLLGVNALVLLTAATQLNAQFLFFADWSDLGGSLGGSTSTTKLARGTTASQAAEASVPGTAPSPGPGPAPASPAPAGAPSALPAGGVPNPDGSLAYTVSGPLSGITATVVVQVPPGYTDPAQAATRYPVLETFHGYPGEPTQWTATMNLGGAMGAAVAAGRMRAAVVVAPQIEVPRGVDTECVNGAQGRPQLETWLTQDVPTWVQRTFRVAPARSSWATIGLSAGGWCAAMATLLHPAQYSAAIVMGGYFRPDFGSSYEPYPPSSPLAQRYDLRRLVQRAPPPVALWLETSHADPLSYSSSAALLKATRAPMAVDATVLQNAGHRVSVWQGLLPQALAWLGTNIPGFAPTR